MSYKKQELVTLESTLIHTLLQRQYTFQLLSHNVVVIFSLKTFVCSAMVTIFAWIEGLGLLLKENHPRIVLSKCGLVGNGFRGQD